MLKVCDCVVENVNPLDSSQKRDQKQEEKQLPGRF